jgi:putative ABC transport system substrate-binding protein
MTFCNVLVAAILCTSAMASGAAAQELPRVGILHQMSSDSAKQAGDDFREAIRSLGWIEGRTVAIEERFANGEPARISANADDFAAAKVDVIVAFSGVPALAARQVTSSIPIVMDAGDPVGLGLVASLARPAGNVTGISLMRPDMAAKQLQLLKEVASGVSKIGVLLQPDYIIHRQQMTEVESVAAALGVSVLPVALGTAHDLSRRFDEMVAAGADGVFVLNEPRTDAMRGDIAALALRHRLPSVAQERKHVEAGVLFCCGVSLRATHRRAAVFVDKILRGAKPADLPVEQPTKFELVVNLKTAKALGLSVPQSILARADEVIE